MPIPELATLKTIPGPMEFLELRDGGEITLRPERWDLGKALIDTTDTRPPHEIPCLRVFVSHADKDTIPAYWDVTSKHLINGMLGYLNKWPQERFAFHIRKIGMGPKARFQIRTTPAKP